MGPSTVQDWLTSRVRSTKDAGLRALLQDLVEKLSLATSEAVTLRRLSEDGLRLEPVAWYHPDPDVSSTIGLVMRHTTTLVSSGLWQPVLEQVRPARYAVPPGAHLPGAAPDQAAHLRRYPVRAMVGAPVLSSQGRLLGSAAMLRYGHDAAFTDDDESLLVHFAALVADLLVLVETA